MTGGIIIPRVPCSVGVFLMSHLLRVDVDNDSRQKNRRTLATQKLATVNPDNDIQRYRYLEIPISFVSLRLITSSRNDLRLCTVTHYVHEIGG